MGRRGYTGAKVKLKRDITTRGGVKFRKGLVMTVCGVDSSGLWLEVYKRGCRRLLHGVRTFDVEVVEWAKKEEDELPLNLRGD